MDGLAGGAGLAMGGVGFFLHSGADPEDDHLLELDYGRGYFSANGVTHESEAALLSANGGLAAGAGRVFGPTIIGANLLANGGFDANVEGWSGSPSFLNTMVEWDAGRLRITKSGAEQNRFSTAINVVAGKCYRHGATLVSASTGSSAQTHVSTGPDLYAGFGATSNYFGAGPLPQSRHA